MMKHIKSYCIQSGPLLAKDNELRNRYFQQISTLNIYYWHSIPYEKDYSAHVGGSNLKKSGSLRCFKSEAGSCSCFSPSILLSPMNHKYRKSVVTIGGVCNSASTFHMMQRSLLAKKLYAKS